MKMKFAKDLRGRELDQDILPINITLENIIQRLDNSEWDFSKLSYYAKRVFNSYKLDKILDQMKSADLENRKRLIRENILTLYGDDIGDNCISVYLVAYCANKDSEVSVYAAVKKFFVDERIEKIPYQIKTITHIGLADGMFLGILDEKANVVNVPFLNKWSYAYINNIFSRIVADFEDEEINRNRFLIYNKIRNKQLDFQTNLIKDKIKQQKKIRLIYRVDGTNEKIALKYLKKRLDLEFNIKYANRNNIMRELFPIIENINYLGDFTIFRYDFKNFFDSVDARKIYDCYIINTNLQRFEKELLKQLTNLYNFCFAGLPTSNAFVEIVASRFDQVLKSRFIDKGLCFCARYVDDGILVFNEFIEKSYIQEILDRTIGEVFQMSSVGLNTSKTCYLTKHSRDLKFNYLGYLFEKKGKSILFGIADSKIEKYQNKLDCIIRAYIKDNNIELFRHRLLYYISRTLFYTNTKSRYSTLGKWDVSGIIENYNLLKKYIKDKNKLTKNTRIFLFNGVSNRCARAGLVNKKMPYFLRGTGRNAYSLSYGLEKNKTIIFHPNIGWSIEYLKTQILRLSPEMDLRKKSYRELSKIYYNILEL
jgi:hypothetical protein